MTSAIPAVFMRGGTSKGLFFHARDLPSAPAARDRLFAALMGSPDPYGRQLDGMGGGLSSLSKVVVVAPPSRADADLDFTFGQVAIDQPLVDYSANCGNLSSAVGLFAVDEGLVAPGDGEALVRLHNTNTGKLVHARFPVAGGRAVTEGRFAIAGVAGTGARVRLDFIAPGGSSTAGLLPTRNPTDEIVLPEGGTFRVSLVDAAVPMIFVAAADFGLTAGARPADLEAQGALLDRLELLRRHGAVRMGMASSPQEASRAAPKIALVGSPEGFITLDGRAVEPGAFDISVRTISMQQVHRAVPLTTAMCLGAASSIPGTVPASVALRAPGSDEVRIGTPSGIISAGAEITQEEGGWVARSAVVYRTARFLMRGTVYGP